MDIKEIVASYEASVNKFGEQKKVVKKLHSDVMSCNNNTALVSVRNIIAEINVVMDDLVVTQTDISELTIRSTARGYRTEACIKELARLVKVYKFQVDVIDELLTDVRKIVTPMSFN